MSAWEERGAGYHKAQPHELYKKVKVSNDLEMAQSKEILAGYLEGARARV